MFWNMSINRIYLQPGTQLLKLFYNQNYESRLTIL